MGHAAIDNVFKRLQIAKEDSDFSYFFSLLLLAEAITKTVSAGMVAGIADDKDRNRYRLEHQLVRADGVGDWVRAIEDATNGPASQFLVIEARQEQGELTKPYKEGEWQYDACKHLKAALDILEIDAEELPTKSDLRRFFRLFATLRNKTRGHGATRPGQVATASKELEAGLRLISDNFRIFKRGWCHLHRNLSGKYRVTPITPTSEFDDLKKSADLQLADGVYVFIGGVRPVHLLETDADLQDFFFANGGLSSKKFELISYATGTKRVGDASPYLTPPGVLPPSETHGQGELIVQGHCLSNAPELPRDYVERPGLEQQLLDLLRDDKRPIVTLLGRGGIGKTSLALRVLKELYSTDRFQGVVWFSSRDVDLQLSGPKPVRPAVLSPSDMGKLYASLVLPPDQVAEKGFNAQSYLEGQLRSADLNPCLFVFDNFETTQNPVEVFNWIDSFIRLPNKALITTRLREFKGDYPVEVQGMEDAEAKRLLVQTARSLQIEGLLTEAYVTELLEQSGGHPYVIKILLGEVAKQGKLTKVPQLVAGTEDILTALFERTYAALSPCSQRAFLTLSAWNSEVPRVALEAVLFKSTHERVEVERGIEALLQYSIAETRTGTADNQEFIGLPLVAAVFGKKKLNVSPWKAAISADLEVLQMLGPTRRSEVTLGLAQKLERFIGNVARRVESGTPYETFSPIVEMICRAYPPAWLIVARWHMERRTQESYALAKEELRRFLEEQPAGEEAAQAWRLLGHACYQTGDALGEVHAFIERAQISGVPFYDISNTAYNLNQYLRDHGTEIDREHKRDLASRLLAVMHLRQSEASADDLSRMAWLALHCDREADAKEYVKVGRQLDPENFHLERLSSRLNV